MKKLSKYQEAVLNTAKAEIDFARNHDFYDWYRYVYNYCNSFSDEEIEKILKKRDERGSGIGGKAYEQDHYNRYKNGMSLVMANTRTLEALEKLGIIRIIKKGGLYPDWIEVIGY